MGREATRARLCGAAVSLLLAVAAPLAASQENWDIAHCGKRFRIVTHVAHPFTFIDKSKCDMKQLCKEAAWKEHGGGLTYKFIMGSVKANLQQMCIDGGAAATNVEFDWYLPPISHESAARAVNVVCNGDFQNETKPASTTCAANKLYMGASNASDCKFRDHVTCQSAGPDMVAGAVHMLRERLDLLDFSTSYLPVRQITVKRGQTLVGINILKTFQCFTPDLWFLGLFMWVGVVWVLILLIEAPTSPQIDKGSAFSPIYDSLYWAFGSALNAGGPGKAPITAGGRIFMTAHWFYLTIVAAIYTGALGPFLTSSTALEVLGYESLKDGHHSVVVRAPPWNHTVEKPKFLGDYRGGTGGTETPASTQFKILQSAMQADSSLKFNIFTADSMETIKTVDGIPQVLQQKIKENPCTSKAKLGAFDMLMCGDGKDSEFAPDAMIADAPSTYYEINKRIPVWKATGWNPCKLKTVGDTFFPSAYGLGFPKNNHYSRAFSIAIGMALSNGTMARLVKEFNISADDFKCHEAESEGSDAVIIDMVAGILVFSCLFIVGGLVHGILLEGLLTGQTKRVFTAIWTCKTQPMPEESESEEEEEEEWEEDESQDLPQTRVGKLCGHTQRMEDYLEKLKQRIPIPPIGNPSAPVHAQA